MPSIDLATIIKWLVILALAAALFAVVMNFGGGIALLELGLSHLLDENTALGGYPTDGARMALTAWDSSGLTVIASLGAFVTMCVGAGAVILVWRVSRWFMG